MGAGKRKRPVLTKPSHSPPDSLTPQTLISSIQSPQGLNVPNLKKLYALLLHWSMNKSAYSCFQSGHFEPDNCDESFLISKDIYGLSDVLFEELHRRFEELFSVDSCWGSSKSIMNVLEKGEELMLLLRCCMIMLILIAVNQKLLFTKGKVLLSILGKLVAFEMPPISDECSYVNGDCTSLITGEFVASNSLLGSSGSCFTPLCAVLEVFADELLVHESLRDYLMLIDSASSRSEMKFNFHFGYGNIGSVLEVLCAHFMQSISSEQAVGNLINRLFWCHRKGLRISEISWPAALSLLLNPVMLSSPKIIQAYLILLISEVIGICTASDNMILDVQIMDWYYLAIERSVGMYTKHMSSFHSDIHHLAGNDSFVKSSLRGSSPLNFESVLLQATVDKLHLLIDKSKSSWDSYPSKMSCRTNSDLVASSIAYVKENIVFFYETHKDEILSILNCIILRCLSDNTSGALFQNEEQDMYLLASLLKLMSSLILRSTWHVRCAGFSGCQKPACKGYYSILHILGCFQQFSIHLPIQNLLHETMQSHPSRHKESKWILFHISGLLSLSYASGVDFLVKGCLFTLMTVLNLFIAEEGDLTALGSLISSGLEPSDKVKGVLVVRDSSQAICSKFRKVQDMYLRKQLLVDSDRSRECLQAETSEHSSVLDSPDSLVDATHIIEETSNGATYLNCVLGKNPNVPDFDDLADFVECQPEKDYAGWLKDREKFRRRKYMKMVKLRWKKKKLAWKSIKK